MPSSCSSALLACALAALLLPASPSLAKGRKRTSAPPPPAAASSTLTAIQADQKQIAEDQAALTKASKELEDASAKTNAAFDASPEVVAAKKAIADASALEESIRQDILARLAKDPAYKAAKADETKLRNELDDLRNENAPQEAISGKAAEVFQAGGITSKMEREAEAADPHYAAAEKKLTDANATLTALRTKFQESRKNDPSLSPFLQAREEAQKKLAADQARLAADRRSGAAAPTAGG